MPLIDLPRFEQQLATVIDSKVGDTYRTFSRYQDRQTLLFGLLGVDIFPKSFVSRKADNGIFAG